MFDCQPLLADQSTHTHQHSKLYVWPLCERKHRRGVGKGLCGKRNFTPIQPLYHDSPKGGISVIIIIDDVYSL